MTKRKSPDQLQKRGRKSTFDKRFIEVAKRMAYLGATDEDLAIAFGVTIKCVIEWRAKHPLFGEALKLGKGQADVRVTRSLYQRAVGYSYDAVKIFMPAGASEPTIVPYVEHVPPDTTAAIFWLKNRDPAHWRDAWQIEASVGKYLISDKPMTAAQWIAERALLADTEVKDVTPNVTPDGRRE
jgi:hypothetical protein